jgi:hypothetical protein
LRHDAFRRASCSHIAATLLRGPLQPDFIAADVEEQVIRHDIAQCADYLASRRLRK